MYMQRPRPRGPLEPGPLVLVPQPTSFSQRAGSLHSPARSHFFTGKVFRTRTSHSRAVLNMKDDYEAQSTRLPPVEHRDTDVNSLVFWLAIAWLVSYAMSRLSEEPEQQLGRAPCHFTWTGCSPGCVPVWRGTLPSCDTLTMPAHHPPVPRSASKANLCEAALAASSGWSGSQMLLLAEVAAASVAVMLLSWRALRRHDEPASEASSSMEDWLREHTRRAPAYHATTSTEHSDLCGTEHSRPPSRPRVGERARVHTIGES